MLNTALYATSLRDMPLPYSLDLARLSAAYDSRRLTPSAVVGDVLAEIERSREINPIWICVFPREDLLERAAELERRREGGERLPLYGVPFAVKDNINVAGYPTTAACPQFAYVPEASAHVVERLERAGAICIGKTNMDQFATGLVGTRSPYGACRNPFDARYVSGGSSSGSAVSVALGQVSFALGTDTAGSGRVPAGFCNLVGFKPTRGLISTRGVVPACRSLDCVSVFALTADDARAVGDAAIGYDAADPFSRNTPIAQAASISGRRFGVPRAVDLKFFGDAIAQESFEGALNTLGRLGADLVEIDFSPFAEVASLLYDGPWVAERRAAIWDFFEASPDAIDPVVRSNIEGASRFSAVDAFEAEYQLRALKRRCDEVWQSVDTLVVPTSGTIYRIDEIAREPVKLNTHLGYYTNFANLLDLAAVAVPAGFREDALPCGVTFIAPALSDLRLLECAARFQRAIAKHLGATPFPLPPYEELVSALPTDRVTLAVVGAHLSGMPLNAQLTSRGAYLLETCSTAPSYRLYALPDTKPPKPGLARVPNGSGAHIEVELWSVPLESFGSFVAEIPPPLGIGTIALHDGRQVKGFVCEGHALEQARDISSFGGWRKYMQTGETGKIDEQQRAAG